VGALSCPHPEKLRWPLADRRGPRCVCGCVWQPYIEAARLNLGLKSHGKSGRMEVYRCRAPTPAGWVDLDHWHLTDAEKYERKHGLDPSVKDEIVYDLERQGRRRWRRIAPRRRSSPGHRIVPSPLPTRQLTRRKRR